MSVIQPDFGAASTTDDVLDGVNLQEKIALVTGASSGLGVETARSLARAGANVVLISRDRQKLQQVKDNIQVELPSAKLDIATVDLSDISSVRNCAEKLQAQYPEINILVNNAGLMACSEQHTEQGLEMQFATNHIGHFLLTCILAPSLLAGAPSRVVTLTSGGHK